MNGWAVWTNLTDAQATILTAVQRKVGCDYFMFDSAVVNVFHQYHLAAHQETTYMWFRLLLGCRLINGNTFKQCRNAGAFRNNKKGTCQGQQMFGVPNEVRYVGTEHRPSSSSRRCRWCSTSPYQLRLRNMPLPTVHPVLCTIPQRKLICSTSTTLLLHA